MNGALFPLQYLLATAALWLNRQQQQVIDYLSEENRLLEEKLGDRKLHFSDAERRRLIFFGETSLRRAIREHVSHYHLERHHQGSGNRCIAANDAAFSGSNPVERRSRLGGLLNFYHREVA
jgi:hypothetical protein